MSSFTNTLIDNSDELHLVTYLKDMISSGEFNHIRIATGYWDLPGMYLVYDELKAFLDGGGKLDIMIGEEPQIRSYQLRDEFQGQRFPDFNIKRDVDRLSDDYIPVAKLLDFCLTNHLASIMSAIKLGAKTMPIKEKFN